MAILHAPGDVVDFTPPDQLRLPEAERVTYRLRVPTVYERVAWRRAIAKAGGRRHGAFAVLAALRRGAERLTDGAPRDFILAAIDEHRGRVEALAAVAGGDDPEAAEVAFRAMIEGEAALAAVSALVVQGDDAYAQIQADNAVYREIAGIEAARLFLEGWEGPLPGAFARGRSGVTDASLACIPEKHLAPIGDRLAELLQPSETESGNSASPSPGPFGPKSSAAASTQPRTTH